MEESLPAVVESKDLAVLRAPDVVLAEAQRAASALADVISRKPRKVVFQGEQYLEFEDWQTVGRFYGVTAKITQSAQIQVGDVIGFEAHAVAIRADGQEVSAADAMCMQDEPNWRTKPLFQLRSMAQTRACAKALRNVLSWVVVLAGYRPTPAEEMEAAPVNQMGQPMPVITQHAVKPSARANGPVISEPQRKRLYAIWKGAGHDDEDVKLWLGNLYGIGSSKEVQKADYDAICARLQDKAPLTADIPAPEDEEWDAGAGG